MIPRLLKLIEDLTNWYIRFNRKRFKMEFGAKDTLTALGTLYEVLFTLSRAMASFSPFLTENMYQGLKKFFPKPDIATELSSMKLDDEECQVFLNLMIGYSICSLFTFS